MRILLADDDPRVKKSIELMDLGHRFDIVRNGRDAVETFERKHNKYDLCLMDMNMPVMNGLEATKEIRSRIKVPYTGIICIGADESRIEEAKSSGMDGFLSKPFDRKEVIENLLVFGAKIGRIKRLKNQIIFSKEKPLSKNVFDEAVELKKKGLALFEIRGIGDIQRFIAHENVQNKASEIFIGEGKDVFEFIDYETKFNHQVYKHNLLITGKKCTPEEFNTRKEKEQKEFPTAKFCDIGQKDSAS